jgi:ATP synthase protein I
MREPEPGQPNADKAEAGRSGDDRDLRARLEALKADLSENTREEQAMNAKASSSRESASALATGMRAASELFAGVLVGAGIGYGLDLQFGTKPLMLLIFMMFGMAAGFWNIYRLGTRSTRKAGERNGPKA